MACEREFLAAESRDGEAARLSTNLDSITWLVLTTTVWGVRGVIEFREQTDGHSRPSPRARAAQGRCHDSIPRRHRPLRSDLPLAPQKAKVHA